MRKEQTQLRKQILQPAKNRTLTLLPWKLTQRRQFLNTVSLAPQNIKLKTNSEIVSSNNRKSWPTSKACRKRVGNLNTRVYGVLPTDGYHRGYMRLPCRTPAAGGQTEGEAGAEAARALPGHSLRLINVTPSTAVLRRSAPHNDHRIASTKGIVSTATNQRQQCRRSAFCQRICS